MTAPAAAATLRDEPLDLGRVWRSLRSPVGIALLFVVVVVVVAMLGAAGPAKPLDPTDASPDGARAVAQLLHDRGVTVHRVTDAATALTGLTGDSLVFVPDAARVSRPDLRALGGSTAPLVVVNATTEELALLDVPARARGHVRVATRDPACGFAPARTAGDAETGGRTYEAVRSATATCYAADGNATLLGVDAGGRSALILGSPDLFTNRRLAHHGNAALALGVLDARDVRWLVPPPVAAATPGDERKGLVSLLPAGVRWAVVTLGVGIVLLALWRARRLGPVVAEPLPVVVRAAETVEGRARLYRASSARATAAAELRAAARSRLARSLGLPAEPDPTTLVDRTAARVARPAPEVGALLYGAGPGGDPPDDAALVRLAGMLDELEATVRST